jgi:proteasome beta subunit
MAPRADIPQTQATTILAFKFQGGVLVAGDRRATAGHTVVYDRADKVLEIDRHSIMAIAGVPATAWEMARVLEHSFQFFRRTQLQEMSVDGKVRALSKLLRDNFGFVLQGAGIVVPIFATYDDSGSDPAARLYFYDAMGAQFEVADYAATGSGSPAVRGILYYENNWGKKPLAKLTEDEAVTVALRALDTAAESDTATGGGRCPRNGLRRYSNGASHDRRAVSLGRSDREPRRIHRDTDRDGQSDRRARIPGRNFIPHARKNAAEAFRDLRSDRDGRDRASGRYRAAANGGDRAGEYGRIHASGGRRVAAAARALFA